MTAASTLKNRHRTIRDSQPESLRTRIHRALSWLARAEKEADDPDAHFLFLWIAFNAAYASEFGFERSEREQTHRFIAALLRIDSGHRLHQTLLHEFTGPVRTLIENRFVFEPFWKALREHDSSGHWEKQFAASKRLALKALLENDTATVLSVVLDRLYVLRNQLIHGGATWRGKANRAQIRDGARILAALVPAILEVMFDAGDTDFGAAAYPWLPD
ncbi:MAG TPA: hypothetical protein VFN09_09040 [Rhodanobacteraceae bacterium]|nr:hypothetical protein [Rhodanobacteraceae bacterium]